MLLKTFVKQLTVAWMGNCAASASIIILFVSLSEKYEAVSYLFLLMGLLFNIFHFNFIRYQRDAGIIKLNVELVRNIVIPLIPSKQKVLCRAAFILSTAISLLLIGSWIAVLRLNLQLPDCITMFLIPTVTISVMLTLMEAAFLINSVVKLSNQPHSN